MTEKDIDWKKVNKETFGEFEAEASFEFENEIEKVNVKISYMIYCFKKENEENYYQRVITLPFYCKSSWGKTSIKEEDIENNIKQLLESKLRLKYKNILTRNYNNNKYKERLVTAMGEKYQKDDYPSKLYHGAFTEKINDYKIGNIWKEFKKPEKGTFISDKNDLNDGNILSWGKFVSLMLNSSCEYCGISMEEINELSNNNRLSTKRSRGYSMEIDQKDPYGSYTDYNCVTCCYWCNNAKTDEFSVEEFESIAKGIHDVWEDRLGRKITFPKETYKNK